MEKELETLLADGIVEEVLGRLKSGKEADIWIVRHGGEAVAAKIYRDRNVRSFRNNAAYKEGRNVASSRTRRAIEKGSKFGRQAEEEAWRSAEADALWKLHSRGVRTPTPIMFYEGVLLMELVLDAEGRPAPRLIDTPLTPEAAAEMYLDLRAQVVRMLDADIIHGDLSPYNVLMGPAGPVIIDFPQHIAAAANSNSENFFKRDVENLRCHFAAYDGSLQRHAGDANEIWRAYVRRELTPDFVPSGRVFERPHGSRPQHGAPRPQGNRPHGDRRPGDRPHADRPHADRPHADRPHADRPHADRPHADRPRGNRPHGNRPPGLEGSQPRESRPHGQRPHEQRPQEQRPHEQRPHGQRPHEQRPHEQRPHENRPARPHAPAPQGAPPSASGGPPPQGGRPAPQGGRPSFRGARPQRPAPVVEHVRRAAGAPAAAHSAHSSPRPPAGSASAPEDRRDGQNSATPQPHADPRRHRRWRPGRGPQQP